tara:strand:+ start:124 stop:810 length:687 start_codon:yes stop_codon:yes gene_type:complete
MFSIIIPLYNEVKNLKILVNELKLVLAKYEEYEIILIDDGSTDSTPNIINKIKYSKIKLLKNDYNKGQSYSIFRGVKNSLYKTIITLDGDGQNDPSDIPSLLKFYTEKKEIKLVGGIRFNRKDNLIKIISSKIANKIRSIILRDNCKDTGCSLKVFDKEIFLSFPYFDGIHRFLPALFSGYGHKTLFINVNHRKRNYGVSKYGTLDRLFRGIRDIIKVRKIIKLNNLR